MQGHPGTDFVPIFVVFGSLLGAILGPKTGKIVKQMRSKKGVKKKASKSRVGTPKKSSLCANGRNYAPHFGMRGTPGGI